jgi:hypothetical protein
MLLSIVQEHNLRTYIHSLDVVKEYRLLQVAQISAVRLQSCFPGKWYPHETLRLRDSCSSKSNYSDMGTRGLVRLLILRLSLVVLSS